MEDTSNQERYHHGYLKKTMIEKGISYIRKNGVENMSFRNIAAMCNVSHTAPYKHFKDKEDFIAQIINYVVEKFSNSLSMVIKKYQDSPDLMIELGVAYVDFFAENPNYFYIVFTGGNVNFDFIFSSEDEKIKSFPPFQLYKEAAISFIDDENMPEDKKQERILFMWALVQGVASIFTLQGIEYTDEQKYTVRKILETKVCFFS